MKNHISRLIIIYIYINLDYPINVKTVKQIGLKFCVATYMTQGEVYENVNIYDFWKSVNFKQKIPVFSETQWKNGSLKSNV